jgi:hypothetical protein
VSSTKVVTALVREARSLSRRADKLNSAAAVVDDPTTQHLVAHHLMVLERQVQRAR